MNFWFILSGLCALGVAFLHIFAGGKIAARPLLADQKIGHIAKFTLWYAWHIVSICIFAIAMMMFFCS